MDKHYRVTVWKIGGPAMISGSKGALRRVVVCGLGLGLGLGNVMAGGCRSWIRGQERAIEDGAVYPGQGPGVAQGARAGGVLAQGVVLNVQVLREGTEAVVSNTSERRLVGRAWVNQWYSAMLPEGGIEPGTTVRLDLKQFKDRFGNGYGAGGFFATENPMGLVQMQIEDGNELIGLQVIGQTNLR
jgi:hypothetical protein